MLITRGLTFDDVLLTPGYGNVSRDDGSVETQLGKFPYGIPIISANMESITGTKMAIAIADLGGLGILHRFMDSKENVAVFEKVVNSVGSQGVAVSVGVGERERVRASMLHSKGAEIFCVDVAHAHGKQVGQMVKHLKATYNGIFVIAGNVATYGGADYLVGVGADAVKIGVGAGSVCTTREVTGFGVPQLTAIMDCARINKPIIADGGIRTSGDVVKALAAGATMVMLGGMLAGTDEALGGNIYRGMASADAREAYSGAAKGAAEGITIPVKSKGTVSDIIREVVGGIKSGLSYCGAKNLDELRRKAVFMEVTQAVAKENMPHGLG